jgi:hypothetical protein
VEGSDASRSCISGHMRGADPQDRKLIFASLRSTAVHSKGSFLTLNLRVMRMAVLLASCIYCNVQKLALIKHIVLIVT